MLGGHVDIQDGTRRFYPVNVGQDLGVSSLLISLVDVALVVALSIPQSARASEVFIYFHLMTVALPWHS